jgi:uncharacterized protein with von Willebrand factor type A (vWA) domain
MEKQQLSAKGITKNTPPHFDVQSDMTKIPFESQYTALKLRMKVKGDFATTSNNHIIIVLDNSGSMAGGAMNMAKAAVKEMCEFLHNCGNTNISLITYNSITTVKYLHELSVQ